MESARRGRKFVLLRVGCLRSFKPAIHFGAKLRRARHAPASPARLFPPASAPAKTASQRRQMTLPEVGDCAKIWRVVRHDHHEIDPLGACLRHPPRGIKTRAIGIEQQGRHHARIEWRLTKPALVACKLSVIHRFNVLCDRSQIGI